VHDSTYSHPRPYHAPIMPVLSNTSRRQAIFTTEILISSLSILEFSKLEGIGKREKEEGALQDTLTTASYFV
jgi:hypothetical protein